MQLHHQQMKVSALQGMRKPCLLDQPIKSMQRTTKGKRQVSFIVLSQQQSIAVTGATGLVGTRLVNILNKGGYKVNVLTRDTSKAQDKFPQSQVTSYGVNDWAAGIKGSYGVVNLAGQPITTRWDEGSKREIFNSRVNVTGRVAGIIESLQDSERPKVFVSSSAVGYYGISRSQAFTEKDSAGNDYLAKVCVAWEDAALKVKDVCRVVVLRNGIILSKEGGALQRMLPIFQIYAGGPIGTGTQQCSWIHRDDIVNLFVRAIQDEKMSGIYNATAPNPVQMRELCSAIGRVLGRPSWLPVPEFAIKALLGEGASVVLEGQKVLPQKAQQEGFQFQYPDVDGALKNILKA